MTENNMKLQHAFQPMPKRFMVWDTVKKKFFEDRQGNKVFTLHTLLDTLGSRFYLESEWCICQSTNLFDKDGKEIFEGSILLGRDDCLSVVQYDGDEGMFRTRCGNVLEDMMCGGGYFENIGHILSNPELVESKK